MKAGEMLIQTDVHNDVNLEEVRLWHPILGFQRIETVVICTWI